MLRQQSVFLSLVVVLVCVLPTAFAATVFDAARDGDLHEVTRYVETVKLDVNLQDKSGRTALSYSAEGGHRAVVDYLVSRGAAASSPDATGRLPLHYAIVAAQPDVARALVGVGSVITKKYLIPAVDNKTPVSTLDFAAFCTVAILGRSSPLSMDSLATLRVIMDEAVAAKAMTSLSRADLAKKFQSSFEMDYDIIFGGLADVKKLVSKGADPVGSAGVDGITCACIFDRIDIYKYFMQTGFVDPPFQLLCSTMVRFGYGLDTFRAVYSPDSEDEISKLTLNRKAFSTAVVDSPFWQKLIDCLRSVNYNLLLRDGEEQNIPTASIFSVLLRLPTSRSPLNSMSSSTYSTMA